MSDLSPHHDSLEEPEAGGNSPVPPPMQSPRAHIGGGGGGGRGHGRRKIVKAKGGKQRRSPRPKQSFVNNPIEYLEENIRSGRSDSKSLSGPLQKSGNTSPLKLMSKTYGVPLDDDAGSLPKIHIHGGE